jgi:hypothetical protein
MLAPDAFRAGERWVYRPPAAFAASRLVVGAVLTFEGREPIVCCAVTGAPRRLPDGSLDEVTIPFLPLTESALAASVVARDGESELPPQFAEAFRCWREDPRGLSAFTVPFEGPLDRLIARQMAEIVGANLV